MEADDKCRILIVEDETILLRMMERVLEKHGHHVDCEEDGALGLARFMTQNYDVVISDVRLPGLDGVAVCRKIKSARMARVVLISACARRETEQAALDAGADRFFLKPFKLSDLLACIERLWIPQHA